MDKNEYNLKLEEMDKYVNQGNYTEAAKVADSIDWRRVRNIRTLCMVSEIYEADKRYEDSKAILTRAYHRSPVGRSVLYRLVEVTIQLKQFDEAIEYYTEYVQAAPNDTNKYILKYKIYRGRGSSLDEQIEILKEYLSKEYNEKWAYELARLYQQAGKIQECLAACDDLVLWFHSGRYVIKALELKQRYAPLTPKQQEIYEHRFDNPEPEEDIFDDAKLGQEKQIVETHEDVLADSIMADTEKEIAQAVAESRREEEDLQEQDGRENEKEPETGDQVRKILMEQAAGEAEEEAAEEQAAGEAEEEAAAETAEEASAEQDVKASEDPESTEEIAESALEQTPKTPVSAETVRNLQSDMVKSMREIVSGVGIRDTGLDEDARNADRLINQSKDEQEADMPLPSQDVLAMNLPKQPENRQAAQISIDDILLSMGEKGDAVRKAAAQSEAARQAREAAPAGVVSAMDEALMNMGVRPDDENDRNEQADQEPEQPDVQAEEKNEIPAEQEAQDAFTDEAPQEEIDIENAKTRRIPTKEIARLHAVYQADIKQEAEEEEQTPDTLQGEAEVLPEQASREQERQESPVQEPAPQEKPGQMRPRRKRPAGPRVDEAYRDLFEGFLEIQDLEAQIATAISAAGQKGNDRTSRTGNILIFGDHGCGKSTIAMGIAKAVAMENGNPYVKLARIYATDLNRKDIAATIAKIAGGTLIIEEAGDLEDETVDQLTTAMEFRTDGLIVILEDEQRYIHELLMRHPRFTMKFTAQIFIPIFTIDDLVNFGIIHAANQDYVLSQEAAAMLYHRIETVVAQGDAISITNVTSLVDRAIHKSNKFFRKVFSGKKRYDENDCVILREKDFK